MAFAFAFPFEDPFVRRDWRKKTATVVYEAVPNGRCWEWRAWVSVEGRTLRVVNYDSTGPMGCKMAVRAIRRCLREDLIRQYRAIVRGDEWSQCGPSDEDHTDDREENSDPQAIVTGEE